MIDKKLSTSEFVTLLYLGIPVFIFFLFFIRYEIAIVSIAILAFLFFKEIKQIDFRNCRENKYLLVLVLTISFVWIFLSGGFGVLYQNSDWFKHYAILNLLSSQEWPVVSDSKSLRYYLGWYLPPALAMKMFGIQGGTLVSGLWSFIGVSLFFWNITSKLNSLTSSIIIMISFLLFSGADLIGYYITGFQVGEIYHFEWWSGWIEYASNTTSLFWVQQHAIPAWLGISLLLNRFKYSDIPSGFIAITLVFVGFWSPFIAIGMAPFALPIMFKFGMIKSAFNWKSLAIGVLIGLPLVSYLLADSNGIPRSPVWVNGCLASPDLCFTLPSMGLFLLIEVGGAALVMITCRTSLPKSFMVISVVVLCLLPLYRIGEFNDFAMRASIPALAILAIACGQAIIKNKFPKKIIPIIVIIIGLGAPVGEVYRGLMTPRNDISNFQIKDMMSGDPLIKQYFSEQPIWVLKTK